MGSEKAPIAEELVRLTPRVRYKTTKLKLVYSQLKIAKHNWSYSTPEESNLQLCGRLFV